MGGKGLPVVQQRKRSSLRLESPRTIAASRTALAELSGPKRPTPNAYTAAFTGRLPLSQSNGLRRP
jgi:hypothetical protein